MGSRLTLWVRRAGPLTQEPTEGVIQRRLHPVVGLSRCAAGEGLPLSGGMADSAIERALDCPARFGHTWPGSGFWPHGHSS